MSLTQDEIAGGWLLHDGSARPPECEFLQFTAYHKEFRYSRPTSPHGWDWRTIKAYRPLVIGGQTWPTVTCPAQTFIPPGKQLDHTDPCRNPAHLELVTHKESMKRRDRRLAERSAS